MPGKAAEPVTGKHEGLTTLQINALAQFLETRNFGPQDIARYTYEQIARLPKIGRKGMIKIEEWLSRHGLQLEPTNRPSVPRGQQRLTQAMRLLRKNGYDVLPPGNLSRKS